MSHMLSSLRPKTQAQYKVYHNRWRTFCILKGVDVLNPPLNKGLDFLCYLFDLGLKYTSLNTARSALSCILGQFDGHLFGQHPLTIRLLRGFYNQRPPCARYASMWNPTIVLDYLRELTPLRTLSLKVLTLKFTMLFLLATCSRQQRLLSIKRDNIIFEQDESVSIRLDLVQKHSRKGKSLEIIKLKPFNEDKSLCVIQNLKTYLSKTNDINNAEGFLMCSFKPPYKRVGTQTLARWVKTTMSDAGIDISMFKPHSTRSASASLFAKQGMPLTEILKKGSWTDVDTFRHFYLRDI